MKQSSLLSALLLTTCSTLLVPLNALACHDLLNFQTTKLRSSESINFCDAFNGKAVLVVNTASQCGYTPQFADLEEIHQQYGDQLAVVGFPSDDFNQEHADTEKIANVCRINYGVTFTMVEPSSVKGDAANPLFKQLAERTGEEPNWNFNKYLISPDGTEVKHFASGVSPSSADFKTQLEALLN